MAQAASRAVFSLRAPTHPVNPKEIKQNLRVENKENRLTDDKSDGPSPDEYEGWVQGNVGQLGEVVEGVLLCPCPDTYSQHSQAQQLLVTDQDKSQ